MPMGSAAPLVDETPPWVYDRPKSRLRAVRSDRTTETVHWSVVALTAFTALSVLIGAYGGHGAPPRELLPVVIYAR